MKMPKDLFERFKKITHSFAIDIKQTMLDEEIRRLFKIPTNRYYSVAMWPESMQGNITVDMNRTRFVETKKISKSEQI